MSKRATPERTTGAATAMFTDCHRGPWQAVAIAICVLWVASVGIAQEQQANSVDEIAVHLYTLQHQRAVDITGWVFPMLSDQGSVELRPGNTIVIRERRSQIGRILEAVRRFDHEKQEVTVSLWLVRAKRGVPISPPGVVDPALHGVPDVLESLRDYLQFGSYEVLGSGQVRGAEGEAVTFELNADYQVKFRLGRVLGLKRVPLDGFEVLVDSPTVGQGPKPLIRVHLKPWVDRPMVLAVSSGESNALVVVIRCELSGLDLGGE